jgi:hypothetical protein
VILAGWLEATWLQGQPLPPPGNDTGTAKGGRDCRVTLIHGDGLDYADVILLGGTGDEGTETAIAVGPDGAVYVAGTTSSTDLPTTARALAASAPGGVTDGFFARIAPDGSEVEWLSYVGGSGEDRPQSLALAPDGALWIGGTTTSTDLPLADPFQSAPSALFLQRIDPLLLEEVDPLAEIDDQIADQLRSGSYFGPPSGPASLQGLVVDRGGRAHLFGHCASGLPVTADAWQGALAGGASDLFLATVAPAAAAVEFATYLGGADLEEAGPESDLLAMDRFGNLHFAGSVAPGSAMPATAGAFRSSPVGATDLFVGRAFPQTGTGAAVLELYTLRGSGWRRSSPSAPGARRRGRSSRPRPTSSRWTGPSAARPPSTSPFPPAIPAGGRTPPARCSAGRAPGARCRGSRSSWTSAGGS